MTLASSSLRRRIIASFLLMTTITCLLFGLFSFLFAYSVEDSLFADALSEEVVRQQTYWRDHRSFARPARDYIALYRDTASLPVDLRRQQGIKEGRSEFAGEADRHYHVRTFDLPGNAGTAYAVAEVSRHLVVRPVRNEMLSFLALWTLGMLALTGLLAYWLADRAAAPLNRLARQVAGAGAIPRISAAGFPGNEVGLLAQTLEQAFDRIRAFVDRESRFTRDASHELRTPVAVIRSAVELIEVQRDLSPSVAKPLGRISDAARQMEQTIDVLLALAREENARPAPERLHLLPLVEAAVLRASELFSGDQHEVSIDIPESRTICVNPTAATIILDNLIGNAFRHARGGRLFIHGDSADLVIGDTGPGLSHGVTETLYSPFAKGEASDGHGLGLSIVRSLCDRNGITLILDPPVSIGTVFRLRFQG